MDDVEIECEQCGGKRFNETALSVKLPLGNRSVSIADVLEAPLDDIDRLFEKHFQVRHALSLLKNVGLGYLKLGRTLDTLSGGELQRVKLVSFLKQQNLGKQNVLVLDEISTGLHPQDLKKLVKFLRKLATQGFTLIVVDHNLSLISQADYNIDMGPGAGTDGGQVVFCGSAADLAACEVSKTGQWLRQLQTNHPPYSQLI